MWRSDRSIEAYGLPLVILGAYCCSGNTGCRSLLFVVRVLIVAIYICWHTLDKDLNDGVPRRSVIKSNWCTTFLPGNNGVPVRTSAKMHPILQISIAGVYCTYKFNSVSEDDKIGRC